MTYKRRFPVYCNWWSGRLKLMVKNIEQPQWWRRVEVVHGLQGNGSGITISRTI